MVIEASKEGVRNMAFDARQVFYDGKVQKSHGEVFQTIEPSTGSPRADIHSASPTDIDSAIRSASKAVQSWSATPPTARSRILLKAVQLLRERNDDIARLETVDTGKPFSETSTVDVVTGADVLEYFAGLVAGGGLNGESIQLREDAWIYTKKEALGVCAGVGAWNYPIQMWVHSAFLSCSSLTLPSERCGNQHHVWRPGTLWCTNQARSLRFTLRS